VTLPRGLSQPLPVMPIPAEVEEVEEGVVVATAEGVEVDSLAEVMGVKDLEGVVVRSDLPF